MLDLSPLGVFLSYRREDAAPYARLLQFQLRERIPSVRVFMDLDSIEPGLDFAEIIREAVDSCTVLVALIGRQWAVLTDEEGRRRLDDPDDYVRFEIKEALKSGVRVIPVLVDGARPLRQQELPAEIQKLARLNALELSYSRYEYDAERLVSLIQRVLDAATGTGTTQQSSPTPPTEVFATPHNDRPDDNAFGEAAQKSPKTARTDPDRASQLIVDSERTAQSITDQTAKDNALADVVWVVADTDPDRAERIAQSITGQAPKDSALAGIARAAAATDPDRAERIAQSITGQAPKDSALAAIAREVATTDPDRAVRIAHSITGEAKKATALVGLALALTVTDRDRASRLIADTIRIAQSITDEANRASALLEIGRALSITDPDRASRLIADSERTAQSSASPRTAR